MLRKAIGATAIVLALALPDLGAAQRVKTGVLNCDVSGVVGLIVSSQRAVRCTFTPDRPGPTDFYAGTISRFGLDIGATGGGQMLWAVYAEYWGRQAGALSGKYSGASAEATVAVGLGAHVLVGGSNRTIALQPLAVQGQVGLNLAVGVAELRLRHAQ